MRYLPHIEQAILDSRKVTEYLLSSDHPFGRAKARFFLGFGFHPETPQYLQDALMTHARRNIISSREVTDFGLKYVIDGPLISPDGRNPVIRSIWIVENRTDQPRFVTAYPLEGNEP